LKVEDRMAASEAWEDVIGWKDYITNQGSAVLLVESNKAMIMNQSHAKIWLSHQDQRL
jgi:hypothetical protein